MLPADHRPAPTYRHRRGFRWRRGSAIARVRLRPPLAIARYRATLVVARPGSTASARSRATTRVAPTFLRSARNWIDASPCSCRRERPYFGFSLRVRELAEFDLHPSRDGSHFVTGLEAGKIRPVLPRPGAAELHAG